MPSQINSADGRADLTKSDHGYSAPADGRGQTVAIIDAYASPPCSRTLTPVRRTQWMAARTGLRRGLGPWHGPGSNGAYVSPVPGTDFQGGAGGGVSAVFAQPAYQKGVVPNSLAHGMRVMPDVSTLADYCPGYVIGISPINNDSTLITDPFTVHTSGGTSLAAPLSAGQMAVAQQVSGRTPGFATLASTPRVDTSPERSPM
ncbi:hypothetical protein AAGW05_04180 [Arthrobacter sp. LAPM80]|uniref:hypothetical protein n=1 Tax=Arthrobacter sp. LAPM80 TaxID=3141788 RepID=UPI00398A7041